MSKQLLSDSLNDHTPKPLSVSLEALEQQHDVDLSIEEQAQSLEMLLQQEEELTNSIATLERMYEKVEVAGTLSQESCEAYALTLESMFGEHAPGIESISLEGIGNFLSRLRQALANVEGRIGQATRDFFSKMIEGVEGLKDRLSAIDNRREEIADMSRPEGYMKARGGSRLHVSKSMDPEKLAEKLPEVAEGINEYKSAIITGAFKFLDHIEETQSEIDALEEPTKDAVKKINKRAKKGSEKIAREIEKEIADFDGFKLTGGLEITVFKQIDFYIDYTTKVQESPRIARPLNMNKMGGYREKDEIRIPSPKEIQSIQQALQTILESVTREHKRARDLIGQTSKAKATAQRIVEIKKGADIRHNDKAGDIIVRNLVILIDNYFGNHLNKWASHVNENVLALYKYQYQVARSGIAYLEKALKQYP